MISKEDLKKIYDFKDKTRKLDFSDFKDLTEDLIQTYNIKTMTHLHAVYGVARNTLYAWFKKYDANDNPDPINDPIRLSIKTLMDNNRILIRYGMIDNWTKEDANASLQQKAYKLLCDESEDGQKELAIMQNLAYAKEKQDVKVLMPFSDEDNDNEED